VAVQMKMDEWWRVRPSAHGAIIPDSSPAGRCPGYPRTPRPLGQLRPDFLAYFLSQIPISIWDDITHYLRWKRDARTDPTHIEKNSRWSESKNIPPARHNKCGFLLNIS
jgi:hypothetical protein